MSWWTLCLLDVSISVLVFAGNSGSLGEPMLRSDTLSRPQFGESQTC